MLEGLYAAAAGMAAQQEQLNAVSNDLANVNTDGYKAERVGFEDLLYNQVNQAGTTTTVGAGAAAHVIGRDEAQGALQQTGQPLDLAIQGEGYFQLEDARGADCSHARRGVQRRWAGAYRLKRRQLAGTADHIAGEGESE